jgi:hypothetical protein
MSNTNKPLDLSGMSREDLEQALREVFTLADVLVGAKDPEWENNCPEWADNGNIDGHLERRSE